MKKSLYLTMLLCTMLVSVQARILRVNNTPGVAVEFTSIEAAYTDAADGDTIYAEGSAIAYFNNSATFEIKKSITILGPGYWLVENDIVSYGASQADMGAYTKFNIEKSGVVLKGIKINTVNIKASNVVITRCRLESIGMAGVSNVVIHQNYITNEVFGGSNVTFTNNIFIGYDINGMTSSTFKYNHIKTTYLRNTITNSSFYSNLIEGTYIGYAKDTYIDTTNFREKWSLECVGGATKFVTDKDYQLLASSDLMSMDPDGKQIGAFGGNDPYVISGIPNIPLIRSLEVPASANQTDGLQVKMVITTVR